jgi:hypothetical protein
MRIDRRRRRFLMQLSSSMASLAGIAAISGSLGIRRAMAALDGIQRRRHLITIQSTGPSGWDAYLYHMGLNPDRMDPAKAVNENWDTVLGTSSLTVKQVAAALKADDGMPADAWTPRDVFVNGTKLGSCRPHPNYAGGEFFGLGPGASVIPDTMLRQDYQIWGGLSWVDGGHDTSVYVINGGMRSQYASSFSCLIADALARERLRPLHYVQVAGEGAIQGGMGMLRGPAEPIAVPDLATWNLLMQLPATDPLAAARDPMARALDSLLATATGSRLKLKTSKQAFESFVQAVRGIAQVRADYAVSGGQLTALVQAYRDDMIETAIAHPFGKRWETYFGVSLTELRKGAAGASGVQGLLGTISTLSFRFALAEYLVKNDLAAVVDVAAAFGDYHGNNVGEGLTILFDHVGMRRLVTALKAVDLGDGRSLLDSTSVVMYTEFDRSPYYSYLNAADPRNLGTDHGMSNSVVMAGMGFHGGRVIGGLYHHTGPCAETFGTKQNRNGGVYRAGHTLPINLDTGVPDPNGKWAYAENLFPTLMSIFGVTIPPQQVTVHSAIPAARRG